jgi:hypothetical protein
LTFRVLTAMGRRTRPHNRCGPLRGQGWHPLFQRYRVRTLSVHPLPPRRSLGTWAMFVRQGEEFRYVAGLHRIWSLARIASLISLCLDYHMGWSCVPKWAEVNNWPGGQV